MKRPRTVAEMERNIAAIMDRMLAARRAGAAVEVDRRCRLLDRVLQQVKEATR